MSLSATPVSERVVFSSVLDGFFHRALKGRVTPRLTERLKKECDIDLAAFKPAIPWATWAQALAITAEELHPGEPIESSYQELGEAIVRGFFQTLVGTALLAMVQLLGPRRTLLRMDRNLRSGNNYAENRLTELGPRHYELWCNEPGITSLSLMGIVRQGIAMAGAKNVRMRIARQDADSVTFDIEWDE